ncbi:acylneuraminate cytidylyltransferase family protein, partial [Gammaproteobacteria bacterium]|nr:acylneuraminate cytidylyltransferase family protein [Gammaproteobacteria bacterium]
MKKKTICIIPARGGSKGLPRKNTLSLDGDSLIGRVVKDALASNVADVVLVTTDDEEIAALATEAGAEVPFIRPQDLSADLTTTEDTLKHALLTYESMVNKEFDTVIFLTATDVFRNIDQIQEVVKRLHENPDLESVFVGYKTHKNFWESTADNGYERVKEWMASYSSRQVRRPIYREDTGLGCASRAWLWREGRRIGDKVD